MHVDMDHDNKLVTEERRLLKQKIHEVWDEIPVSVKRLALEVKKAKLKYLKQIEDWSKNNGHEALLELVSRQISCLEKKIEQSEQELKK